MVNIIFGKNAIGKTKVLSDKLESNGNSVVSNLVYDDGISLKQISNKKLQYIERVLECKCNIVNDDITITSEVYNGSKYIVVGKEFSNIITVLCKNAVEVLIDEPECVLTDDELLAFIMIFDFDEQNILGDVWITTHSDMFSGTEYSNLYTVVNNELIRINEEKAYEYTY